VKKNDNFINNSQPAIYEAKELRVYIVNTHKNKDGFLEIDADVKSCSERLNNPTVRKISYRGSPIKIRTLRLEAELSKEVTFDKLNICVVPVGLDIGKQLRAIEPLDACEIVGSKLFNDYQAAVMKKHFDNGVDLPCNICQCKKLEKKDFIW